MSILLQQSTHYAGAQEQLLQQQQQQLLKSQVGPSDLLSRPAVLQSVSKDVFVPQVICNVPTARDSGTQSSRAASKTARAPKQAAEPAT
jgi:hypothetical protein